MTEDANLAATKYREVVEKCLQAINSTLGIVEHNNNSEARTNSSPQSNPLESHPRKILPTANLGIVEHSNALGARTNSSLEAKPIESTQRKTSLTVNSGDFSLHNKVASWMEKNRAMREQAVAMREQAIVMREKAKAMREYAKALLNKNSSGFGET